MTASDREIANKRATAHLYAWCALNRLWHSVKVARGTVAEGAALDAYATVTGLLDVLEADASGAGWPLVRPGRSDKAEGHVAEEAEEGGWPTQRPDWPIPAAGMTTDRFHAWQADQPDTYELIRGIPIRLPDEAQGGRRLGRAYAAAELALGFDSGLQWLRSYSDGLGGRQPLLVANESWQGLAAVIEALRSLTKEGGELHEGAVKTFAVAGETLDGLLEQALRMVAVERARTRGSETR